MSEDTTKDVQQDSSPAVGDDVKAQVDKAMGSENPQGESRTVEGGGGEADASEKGAKTPESNLFAALDEERRMRKELQKEVEDLKNSVYPDPDDEDGAVRELRSEVQSLKDEAAFEKLSAEKPALKELRTEFDEFRTKYPSVGLSEVADLFLHKKGVTGAERKGLERPSGGERSPQPQGMSQEDVKRLRTENPRKYLKLIQDGKLDPDQIR